MESDARYTWVGAVMMAMLLLLAGAIYWLSGTGSRPPAKRYTVLFHSQALDGVQTGTEVRMRGIKVGRVIDYGIPPGDTSVVRVILEVDERVPLLQGARIVVNRNLLTGLAQLSLANVSTQAPRLTYIPPGERYPLIAEGTPEIERIAGLAKDLGSASQETLERVNRLLSEHNQQAISQTLDNTEALTGQLAEAVPDLRATLADTRQAVQRLDGVAHTAETTLQHADQHIEAVSARSLQTLDAARTLLARSQDEIGALSMQLKLSADLAGQEIHATAASLRQTARDVQQPARAWAEPERLLFGPPQAALGPGEK